MQHPDNAFKSIRQNAKNFRQVIDKFSAQSSGLRSQLSIIEKVIEWHTFCSTKARYKISVEEGRNHDAKNYSDSGFFDSGRQCFCF